MSTTDHISSILKAFEIEPGPLDRIVHRYLRDHREINSRDRRIISDTAFGVMRFRRRIDGVLTLKGIKKIGNEARVICYRTGEFAEVSPKRFPGGMAAYHSLPDIIYDRLVKEYGVHGASVLSAKFNEPASPVLRINSILARRDDIIKIFEEKGVHARETGRSPFGIELQSRINLGAMDEYKNGLIEVQDEASQLAVIASDPQPGELVLDACAGAGGKSLMLAMLMENRGRIISSDISPAKLKELARRASRAKVTMIDTCAADKLDALRQKGRFDLVFVDAPCSGSGTFRRSPDLKWRIDGASLDERVKIQTSLLEKFASFAKPGGRIAYATCSVLAEENENIVEAFLRSHPFDIVCVGEALEEHSISDEGLVSKNGFLKTNPCHGPWDGFFVAILRKMA